MESIKNQVLALFKNETQVSFDDVCHQIFKLQSTQNKVYNQYLEILGTDINSINSVDDIPLLPIRCFKSNDIKTGQWSSDLAFLSSGTTQLQRSRHWVKDKAWYNTIAENIFRHFFPSLEKPAIYGLLPGYLENPSSSLIEMVKHLIDKMGNRESHIYNLEFEALEHAIKTNSSGFLFAVTFALFDFLDSIERSEISAHICFTGGMKGRGAEVSFQEVVSRIHDRFPSAHVCAEYGMTELFSQAYAGVDGIYKEAPTLRIALKEITDPLSPAVSQRSAQLGAIDLANVDTLSFILTEDLVHKVDNGFRVLGRLDNSDTRGCNLMYLDSL